MTAPAVYGSSDSRWRSRLFSPLAARARARRHDRFFRTLTLAPDARILDVGCGRLGLRALEPERAITGTDLLPIHDYPGPFVQADVLEGLPFADGEFDLVYCSSVIEHVSPENRPAFVAELKRVGKQILIQTPARSFPIEPHAVLPFAHWLPPGPRRIYWRLGVQGSWEDIALLGRRELSRLTGLPVLAERVGPMAKSWLAIGPTAAGDPAQVGR